MDEKLEIREKGGVRNGVQQFSERRLFMQLLGFGDAEDTTALIEASEQGRIPAVLYSDVHDARGVGLLTWSDDALFFVTTQREFLRRLEFAALTANLEYLMLG